MKKYRCTNCVNLASPLCDYCTVLEMPSGKEQKPKYYIGSAELGYAVEGNIPTLIKISVENGVSIPLIAVYRYNEELEKQTER